ncbi:MAG: hypothetical protein K2P51_08975, partial [Rhabdochlamydiaceae bacterium]|nr:hypothetical protein [Rhabdochlamydiaceae bacterium]
MSINRIENSASLTTSETPSEGDAAKKPRTAAFPAWPLAQMSEPDFDFNAPFSRTIVGRTVTVSSPSSSTSSIGSSSSGASTLSSPSSSTSS